MRPMRPRFVRIALGLTSLLTACSSSSAKGMSDAATRTDGTPNDVTTPGDDAGAPKDASTGMDAPAQPTFTLEAGSTWTALYRDYFGNNTQVHTAGCANGGFCHASTSDDGYARSGYLCPDGDKESCYKSFTMSGVGFVMPDGGFTTDGLGMILCQVNDAGEPVGDGFMPYNCVYNFTPVDVQRIEAWLAAGYPDN